MRERVNDYNQQEGRLKGYDCRICKNKGHIAVIEDGYEVLQECKCQEVRRMMKNIRRSGLAPLLDAYTFDAYKTDTPLRAKIKESAQANACSGDGWFYIGGQVGFGKTHICTAIVGEMLKRGVPCRYMLWRDVMSDLYVSRFDDEYYETIMRRYKFADVLYIDDLYKGVQSAKGVEREIMERNATYEIINHRYMGGLKTIISSEYTIRELMMIDQSVASRIYERTKGSAWEITQGIKNNARLQEKVKGA